MSTVIRVQVLILCTLSLFVDHKTAAAPLPWTKAKSPSAGESQSIGGYAYGCLQGAAALAERGLGYRSIRRYRNRYYAHPQTIKVVESIGREVKARGLDEIEVGDLSQPRGGRMKYGHRSHQSGLDIDLWFGGSKEYLKGERKRRLKRIKRKAKKKKWSKKKFKSALFDVDHPSTIKGWRESLDEAVWSTRHEQLLKIAASQPEVARIFVHFRIKEKMCALYRLTQTKGKTTGPEPLWLRKLRPWYGHHQHFHVRLHCPSGSPECDAQGPLPDGLNCEGLDWFSKVEKRKRKKETEKKSAKEEERRASLSPKALKTLKRQEAKKRRVKKQKEREKKERLIQRCQHLSP